MRIAVQHAAWDARRRPGLERLLGQLEGRPAVLVASERREHPSVFGTRLWESVAGCDGPTICLEDDVEVPRGFVAACEAAFAAGGGRSLSLHLQAPGLRDVAATGARWARCYWLSTVACVLTPVDAASLLDFAAALSWRWRSQVAHDNVAIHWAWSRQRPFLATIPCLAAHDGTVPSTLGYDAHPNRGPGVMLAAGNVAPLDWPEPGEDVPYVDNPWATHAWLVQVRHSLATGVVCSVCLVRPGEVGSANASACRPCLAALCRTAIQGSTTKM